jgi:nucleotide-binding universal stress UspA family protein
MPARRTLLVTKEVRAMDKPLVVVGVVDRQPAALRFAADRALSAGAGLRVVHCVESLSAWDRPPLSDLRWLRSGQTVLEAAREVVGQHAPGLDTEYVVIPGSTGEVLVREAGDAVMLVVGTDSERWADRLLGGRVTARVTTDASVPVAVVPERPFPEPATGVVLALDARSGVHGSVRFAFTEASRRGLELQVIHIFPIGKTIHEIKSLQAEISRTLAGWSQRFPEVTVRSRLVFNEVDAGTLRAGREVGLLVLGRRPISPLTVLFGHPVLSEISREARCPCVVVPEDWDPMDASLPEVAHSLSDESSRAPRT